MVTLRWGWILQDCTHEPVWKRTLGRPEIYSILIAGQGPRTLIAGVGPRAGRAWVLQRSHPLVRDLEFRQTNSEGMQFFACIMGPLPVRSVRALSGKAVFDE